MIHLEEERRTGGFSCASKLVYNIMSSMYLGGKVNKFLQLSLFSFVPVALQRQKKNERET